MDSLQAMMSSTVPLHTTLPPCTPRAGADVDNIVGGEHGVLIVFDDDDHVADVAQALEGGEQFVVVPLMQADARLIQDGRAPP